MPGTNALAYSTSLSATKKKRFYDLDFRTGRPQPGTDLIKLFIVVNQKCHAILSTSHSVNPSFRQRAVSPIHSKWFSMKARSNI